MQTTSDTDIGAGGQTDHARPLDRPDAPGSHRIAPLRVPERPQDKEASKWARLFNVVVARQNAMQDGRALVRLVMEVISPVGSRPRRGLRSARTARSSPSLRLHHRGGPGPGR